MIYPKNSSHDTSINAKRTITDAFTTRTHYGNPKLTRTRLVITKTLAQLNYEKRETAINETINECTKCSSVQYTTKKSQRDDDTKNDKGKRETNERSIEEPTSQRRLNERRRTTTERYSGNGTFHMQTPTRQESKRTTIPRNEPQRKGKLTRKNVTQKRT